jgi:hypothetical protein
MPTRKGAERKKCFIFFYYNHSKESGGKVKRNPFYVDTVSLGREKKNFFVFNFMTTEYETQHTGEKEKKEAGKPLAFY